MSSCLVKSVPEPYRDVRDRLIQKETVCLLCGVARVMRMSGSFLWVRRCDLCGLQWHGEPVTGVRVGERWMEAPEGVMAVGRDL